LPLFAVAASVFAVAMLAPDWFGKKKPDQPVAGEATSTGVALVARLVGVEWPEAANQFEPGDLVTPGEIEIDAGLAQIEFFCGATVVLEGPARLQIHSDLSATLAAGKLRAEVPPAARGFAINTSGFDLVDRGTEFGLSVNDKQVDVQVFDGEVELFSKDGASQKSLFSGESIRHSGRGFIEAALPEGHFVSLDEMQAQNIAQSKKRYERWKSSVKTLRADPRLIAYFTFEDSEFDGRTLRSNMNVSDGESDGAIVGADRVVGRWEEKDALEFKHPGDRVRLNLEGEYESLSFAAWVRIDSLDRSYNSLFLTDSYNYGEPHWQILDTGQLFLSVRPSRQNEIGKVHVPALSEPFWNSSLAGDWFFLVSVYDNSADEMRHYVNGELVTQQPLVEDHHLDKLVIGKASLGNWDDPTRDDAAFKIRNLNGRIDEFAIFNAPITSREVKAMYEKGKP
jgi:hypothetical protein